jgi:hypothetical protein
MTSINLSQKEIDMLLTSITLATGHMVANPDAGFDTDPYNTLGRKLERYLHPPCSHCRQSPSRRSNGLCDACNSYERKQGRLPGATVLEMRRNRKLTKRTST